jgi:hypothetical protein
LNISFWDTRLEGCPEALSEAPLNLLKGQKAPAGLADASNTAPVRVAVDKSAASDSFGFIMVFQMIAFGIISYQRDVLTSGITRA